MAYAGLCTLYQLLVLAGTAFDEPTKHLFEFLLPREQGWKNVVVFFMPAVCETGCHILRHTLSAPKVAQWLGTAVEVVNAIYMVQLWLSKLGFNGFSVFWGIGAAVVYVICNIKLAGFLVSKLRALFTLALGTAALWPDLKDG